MVPLITSGYPCFAGEAIRFADDTGDEVVLSAPARRIVSLYAGHTENLEAIGAGDFIAAVGRDSGSGLPALGARPGIERIIALSPDLVLTRPMMVRADGALYDSLKSFGIAVAAIDPPAWEEFPGYIGRLSAIVGLGDEPEAGAARAMREAARIVPDDAPGALLETNGRIMATCTPDSWAAHMLAAAGFRNAAAGALPAAPGSVIGVFGAERTIASDERIDVILLQQGTMNTVTAADFMKDGRFSRMRAVRNGMVFDVSEEDVSRPSLRRLWNGALISIRERAEAGGESRWTTAESG
ncbi:MAG: ABC transporter substrate-binding protein [Synergistaceae bacterium]|jgi:iron complex transport system substrate-binding protein|nr:ABC transporter substrate-binding protein [Synergistaceae bacterium]